MFTFPNILPTYPHKRVYGANLEGQGDPAASEKYYLAFILQRFVVCRGRVRLPW
jgi:hypothetical protein